MAVRWGVIGAGGIADRRTIPEMLQVADNAQLVALMDVSAEAVARVAAKYGVSAIYTDEEALLSDPQVEAVYIATPQNVHHRQVLAAARHGKHVLCEKPMATSMADAEEMIEACARAGVKLGLDYMMRFNIHNQKIRELVASGALGQLVMGRAELTCWYPPMPTAWRQKRETAYGGSLIDMGSHCLDILEWIFDSRITEVFAFHDTITHSYDVEDTSTTILRFENGAHGIVDNYFNVPDEAAKNLLEVYGTQGSILASGTIGQDPTGTFTSYLAPPGQTYSPNQVRDSTSRVQAKTYQFEGVPMYGTMVKLFSQAIEEGGEPPVPGEVGLHNLRVIMAIYEAARSGRPVKISYA
ncbi:MAG: Gfo/Idh/MocA family oxidoreductase [Anaerolineae bacterium]|nr:Gfo/Idh/MocA family oxidoreductase [Anaerolineae bacterium]